MNWYTSFSAHMRVTTSHTYRTKIELGENEMAVVPLVNYSDQDDLTFSFDARQLESDRTVSPPPQVPETGLPFEPGVNRRERGSPRARMTARTARPGRSTLVRPGRALVHLRCAGSAPCSGFVKLGAWMISKQVVRREGRRQVVRRPRLELIGFGHVQVPAHNAGLGALRLNRKGKLLAHRAMRAGRSRMPGQIAGHGVLNRRIVLRFSRAGRTGGAGRADRDRRAGPGARRSG